MSERQYDKLVRDKIPEIIRAKNGTPITHVAESDEFQTRIMEKLLEECDEFRENPCVEELADIAEVIRGLSDHLGIDPKEVEACRRAKFEERGGFSRRIVLEKVIEAGA